ncbi:MAG: hypothetical protein H7Y22_16245 [Gemmatimonadaceae bacterium]|nr:hypothetical protein [Gloeobacterales cyanobacterium ES-bin-141]
MKQIVVGVGLVIFLVGCSTPTPVARTQASPKAPVDPPVKRQLAFPVTGPGAIFLLKADGMPFKEQSGKYTGELAVKPYTSRLNLTAESLTTPSSRRLSLVVQLPNADRSHNVSDDRPVAFLEVDGQSLREGLAIDSTIYTITQEDAKATNIKFNFLEPGTQQVLAARERVAVKVRLQSDVFANAGECTDASPGSAPTRQCRKPYTGRTIEGPALVKLKTFFGPPTAEATRGQ